jgi:hypothetical protein
MVTVSETTDTSRERMRSGAEVRGKSARIGTSPAGTKEHSPALQRRAGWKVVDEEGRQKRKTDAIRTARDTQPAPRVVLLSEAKDLCTPRQTASILRPANNADLRMTSNAQPFHQRAAPPFAVFEGWELMPPILGCGERCSGMRPVTLWWAAGPSAEAPLFHRNTATQTAGPSTPPSLAFRLRSG